MKAGAEFYRAVVIGCSAGGLDALSRVLPSLPAAFPAPLVIVQHINPRVMSRLHTILKGKCAIDVREADEKIRPQPGVAYLAPPNYHLLLELDGTFSLNVDERVNYSRPSVDVTFETAAESYGSELIGVVMTGASADGSRGLARIKLLGGYAIVQDPREAQSAAMPEAALKAAEPQAVLPLRDIGPMLIHLCG
ncbi:MAG TPA: chemotaxis protein CheB [Syntrophales bacterium]|nr:chemotaxis protein CheB [Syntrophales bacterium]